MATGRSRQPTGQAGEHLVAAELCRRGLTATTFTSNVPDYDIVAVSVSGEHVLVQVKANLSGAWQFADARQFIEIEQEGPVQHVGKPIPPKYPDLVFVFVRLSDYGNDRFFILKATAFWDLVGAHYRKDIEDRNGVRARNPLSYHVGIGIQELEAYEDRWDIITGARDGSAVLSQGTS